MVFFDRTCPELQTDEVIVDDYAAAYRATEYLIKTGCKRIAHYKGPENLKISEKRLQGFIAALNDCNIKVFEDLIIKCDDFEEGKAITERLIQGKNIPDGIFTVNDMSAVGAIESLKKYNIKIPDEVAVVGFTNGLISMISDPPLTTVEQHGFDMGYKAAELLINRISSKEDYLPIREIIPTKLIIRKSTY